MLNLSNIDLARQYRTTEDELRETKSYIYQLVEELDFRFGQLYGESGNEIENEIENKTINPYPVGAIYLSIDNTDPSVLFGGEWEQIAEGRTLFGAGTLDGITYTAGETKDAGLPNISGKVVRAYSDFNKNNTAYSTYVSGPFYYYESEAYGTTSNVQDGSYDACRNIYMDASRQNPIYGNSATVQPNAFIVYMWKRTA